MRFKVPFRGVHIGPTCIDGSEFGTTTRNGQTYEIGAHAHCSGDRPVGYICARSLSAFRELVIHEIAHLAADSGHDDRWRKTMRRLGGRVPAAYQKRPRKK